MKLTLTVAAAFFCLFTFAQQKPNTISAKEKKEGWKLLFDGKTTKGWHSYGKKTTGSLWKVKNAVLCLDTAKNGKVAEGGNLLTNSDYENFHFKIEWKISPNGNSGLLFMVNEDTARFSEPYESGPEMQILDNDGHPDGKIIKHRAGDLYDLISCSKETVKPVGEWNKAEIIIKDGKLELILNGVKVVATTMWDDNWAGMIAGSKFKEWPGFGTFKKGKICLQDHGNMVCFRNIKIKAL